MTKAPQDPETLSFEATVLEGGTELVLSETYFYPEGGGQPPDRGTVAGVEVHDVQRRDGAVVHALAEPVEEGTTVTCAVDPEFRRYCARAHTASHALYGAGRRLLDDLGYGGFGISPEKVRVDFSTTTDVDDGTLVELERLVNRTVWDSREVTWEQLPREEALSRRDDGTGNSGGGRAVAPGGVAFNTKTEEGVAGDAVRVVTIDGWDAAACGGTHVRNTREVGPVTVLGRSNPGEGLTRVEFAVGQAGIDRRTTEKRAVLDAAAELGTNVAEVPDAVARLGEENAALETERDDLRAELVETRLAELPAVERDGAAWLVGEVDLAVDGLADLDANALADRAREASGDRADVVALVSPNGTVAVASACDVDAGDVVDDVTAAFGGGGGGSPRVAQGGGLDAAAEQVIDFLRRE